MAQLFTPEEQGMQGTTSDFLPIAKLFGLGLLGGGLYKGASKLGGKMDDSIKAIGNKPLFSKTEWEAIKKKLSSVDDETKYIKDKSQIMQNNLKMGI